ncbi:MAG TPA: FtsX-like permease family protein, partial [Vicinamibacterales bacterium]|nr:FtsX-like permease family protein [Vicinamibacterales bacterium]
GLGTAPLSTQPLELVVDARLLVWTLIASLGAALACSVLPAFRLTGSSEVADLRHQTAGSPRLRLARSLVAAQIAVSMPLLVGAVLFLQTLANLVRVELGFNPSGLSYLRLDPVAAGVPAPEHAAIYQSVLARLRAVPGVRSATLMENVFLSGITSNTGVTIDGERRSLYMNAVGPDFTETLGMRLLAGRAPDARDVAGAPRTAAINEAAARLLFGSASPLGRTVDLGGGSSVEVVGVVSDSLYDGRRADVRPIMFDSALQRPGFGGHHLVIRTAVPVAALESDIRQALAGVHRDLPVPEIRTQAAQVGDSIARERVFTQVLMLFGGFALLLAGLGLHGMTAYAVSRRRSEFGVRVALGARPGQVLWLVLRQVVALAAIGLCAGIPLSLAVAPVVSSVLFGVEPTEAWAVATASVAMLAVAIGSGLVPARRAATMDPLAALRTE